MRVIVVVAAGILFFAAPGLADAGGVSPIEYAYGGGPNAAAVVASRPNGTAGGRPIGPAGPSVGSRGAGQNGTPDGRAGAGSTRRTARGPLVGLAASPATAAGTFGAFERTIPMDALWAIALAITCALGAWLLRRGRGAG